MSARPWYPMYPTDYLVDTSTLKMEEHGLYHILLHNLWIAGGTLPSSPDELAMITRLNRRSFQRVFQKISHYFVVENGLIYNKRLLKEYQKASELSDKRRDAANTRYPAKAGASGPATSSAKAPLRARVPQPQPQLQPQDDTSKQKSSSVEVEPSTHARAREEAASASSKNSFNGSGILMLTCTGEIWEVPAIKIIEWEESFPDVDVPLTLLGARQWLRDHPQRRKTADSMVAFLGDWMRREQDKPDTNAKTTH